MFTEKNLFDLAGMIFGIFLGKYLNFLLHFRLSEHALEYIRMAKKSLRGLLGAVFLLEVCFGAVFLVIFSRFVLPDELPFRLLATVLLGYVIAHGVIAPEYLLANFGPHQKGLSKWLFRLLSRLHLNYLQRFEAEIQKLMENDNFDWQAGRGDWNLGVDPVEIGRRLRKLYEIHKLAIANCYRRPWLMRADISHFPGRKFYPLVKFLGRRRLLQLLRNPVPSPSGGDVPKPNGNHIPRPNGADISPSDWDGSERRKEVKSTPFRRRSYDDKELMKRIKEGVAC